MHAHDHGPSHAPAGHGRAFAIGVGLNTLYVALEAGFGLMVGSLALVADAGHNLSDVFGLLLAWGGAWLSSKGPTQRRTYGYKRSSILAALGNAMLLLLAVGAILVEAVRRLLEPQPVPSTTILWVAAVGLVVNGVTAWFFMAGRKGDINIRGAFLHMVADTAVTAGVIVAALVIMATGWLWVDPAVAIVIAAVILVGTWGLLRDSVNLSLDAVPEGIDMDEVEDCLRRLPGVTDVHDLHVWAMSTTEPALTVHLVRPEDGADDALLDRLRHELHARFGIEHTTVQFETGNPAHPCPQAPAHVV
jgi:cobalt-zinc-cadmium efflux system protein